LSSSLILMNGFYHDEEHSLDVCEGFNTQFRPNVVSNRF
jgi:hypothetical protein